MKPRKFQRDEQEYIYRLYLSDDRPGVRDSLQTAFHRGHAGYPSLSPRSSLAYAAWAAGRDKSRAGSEAP